MLSEEIRREIGDRIREARMKSGLTQSQLAETLDVSTSFLSEVETGKKGMSFETFYAICESIEVSSDFILFGPDAITKPSKTIIEIAQRLDSEELNTCINFLTALRDMEEM